MTKNRRSFLTSLLAIPLAALVPKLSAVKATSGTWLPFGPGILAMLHGRERIMPLSEGQIVIEIDGHAMGKVLADQIQLRMDEQILGIFSAKK